MVIKDILKFCFAGSGAEEDQNTFWHRGSNKKAPRHPGIDGSA